MNKVTLYRVIIGAVIVGIGALLTGYFFNDQPTPNEPAVAEAPVAPKEEAAPAKETVAEKVEDKPVVSKVEKDEPKTEAASEPTPPSFDVVGVEPTGDAVLAGRSLPNAIVVLVANGKVVGRSLADKQGEWTIILDKPLNAGDYDVSLETLDKDGKKTSESRQRLAVSIPDDGTSKPLVVMSEPDAPSTVLQVPDAVADAGTDLPAKDEEVATATDSDVSEAETTVAALAPAEKAEEAAVPSQPSAKTEEAPAEPDVSEAPEAVEPAASEEGKAKVAAVAPSSDTASDEAPAADLVVTVDAVEAEKGTVYVAGTAEAKHLVRVYVGDKVLGEADLKGSDRWLVQGDMELEAGEVEVRADMLDAKSGEVVARAAVTFNKAAEEAIILTRVTSEGEADTTSRHEQANVDHALPNVIIRKGDNLWNIAQRLYGSGFRYTTIYQANKTQIRDPDLIYPGQVFLTPENDRNWETN